MYFSTFLTTIQLASNFLKRFECLLKREMKASCMDAVDLKKSNLNGGKECFFLSHLFSFIFLSLMTREDWVSEFVLTSPSSRAYVVTHVPCLRSTMHAWWLDDFSFSNHRFSTGEFPLPRCTWLPICTSTVQSFHSVPNQHENIGIPLKRSLAKLFFLMGGKAHYVHKAREYVPTTRHY